ncbi:MAG: hypothetical protein ACJARD_000158 [Alphaproteobacteria bacterium]|jgi:hypothetical protein
MTSNIIKHNNYPNRHLIYAAFVFCMSLAYYLSLLHLNIAHAHDSPIYYTRIISDQIYWHPHHLLYEPASAAWFYCVKLIFPAVHPFKMIASLNSFFGAGCITMIYLIAAQRLNFSNFKALMACVMIGSSFFYLNYATTVEVYHVALFFVLASFYYVTKETPISFLDAMIIGIFHGLAMSFHQMHFLLGFVLLPRMLRAGLGKFAIYFLYGSLVVVASYVWACYFERIYTFYGFLDFAAGYLDSDSKVRSGSSSPLLAPLGLGIALLGGRYIMSTEPFKSFILEYFPDAMYERIFILHDHSNVINMSIQILFHCMFLFCAFMILKSFVQRMTIANFLKHTEYYLVIAIYSLFFIFWYPHNPEFWGLQLAFLILIFLTQHHNHYLLCFSSFSILIINLLGTGLALLDPNNNLYPNGVESLF